MIEFFKKRKKNITDNAIDENLIELLKTKFVTKGSGKDTEFLKEIMEWINDHDEQAIIHKDKYFRNNIKISKWKSLEISAEKVANIIKVGISIIGTTFIIKFISDIWNTGIGKWSKSILSALLVIVLVVILVTSFGVFFSKETKQEELRLRQYGETWIRHRCTWWELKQEVLMYLYELGRYSEKTDSMQKQLFMERIVEIENADMKQFQKNMENIQ